MASRPANRSTGERTSRLYYHDATLREFVAEVIAIENSATGTHSRICLNRTAFYPSSGGQPHDTGTLNGVPVIDVIEDDNGEIWHLLAEPLASDTRDVHGQIDWVRRFDHMQQHTGQHLLSAAFDDAFGARTVGFHLGTDASTIDLETDSSEELEWEQIFAVETAVNRIIWENRPITTLFLSEDEIDRITLRKPPAVTGDIRVIEVAGYDASACGGTHVAATGEIGLIKVTGLERYKQGLRVTFLAGERALHHYQEHLRLLQTSSLALSVGPGELPQAIARLEESVKSAQRGLRQLREELLTHQADRLWAEAPVIDSAHVVANVIERTFAEAQALAGHLRKRSNTLILFAVAEHASTRLVCARSDDLGQFDAAAILRGILDLLQGRGGGGPTMAQGGAPAHSPEQLRRALRQTLAHHNLSSDSDLSHSSDSVD
jgi:alanyl-tRNA synthetase